MQRKNQPAIKNMTEPQRTITVKTTLYDLIEAVGVEVDHNEEPWIPLIVNHMLSSAGSAIHPS
ncbi:hypothetical protein ACFL9U_15885 [Thermodesulfobacteriota bacterium]